MDLTAMLTDDQLGVLGCFVALGVCGLVAAVTFHAGPAGKKTLQSSGRADLPKSVSTPISSAAPSETRRAA